MDADFWHRAWAEGRIGFHMGRAHPALDRYWAGLQLPAGTAVLVPLCGKAVDMAWFAARGHPVVGVELSEIAARDFFREQGIEASPEIVGGVTHWRGGGVDIVIGDIFALAPGQLGPVGAVFDRAALVALPPDRRAAYVRQVRHLAGPSAPWLLVTLEYDPARMDGPPFSVDADEVRTLFAGDYAIEPVEAQDIIEHESRFRERGLEELVQRCWRLRPGAG